MSPTCQVVLSDSLRARIDEARGDIPFSAWMRRAAEQRLMAQYEDALSLAAARAAGLGPPVEP